MQVEVFCNSEREVSYPAMGDRAARTVWVVHCFDTSIPKEDRVDGELRYQLSDTEKDYRGRLADKKLSLGVHRFIPTKVGVIIAGRIIKVV